MFKLIEHLALLVVAAALLVQPGDAGPLDAFKGLFGTPPVSAGSWAGVPGAVAPPAEGPAVAEGPGALPRAMAMAPEGAPVAEQSPQDEAALQTDECSANADCDACLKQTNCVWCTEVVEFHDGSQGSRCLFHDPFRKTRRFKCPGVFSDKSCSTGEKGMEFLEKVQEQAEAIKDGALSVVEDAKHSAVDAVQDAAEDVKDKAVDAAEDVKNKTVGAVQTKVEEMKETVVDAMQKVLPFDISGGETDNKTSETAEVGQPSQTPKEEGAAIAPAGQPSPEDAQPKVEKPTEPQEPGANRPGGKLTHMDKLRKRKQDRRKAEGKKDIKGKVQKKFGKS